MSRSVRVAILCLLPLTVPTGTQAAGPATRDAAAVAQTRTPDFLFGRPPASIGIRGEWVLARADSELFDFVSDLLTLEKSDFNALGIGIDFGIPVTSRLDTLIGFAYSKTSSMSNYRDLIDDLGSEIVQTTQSSQVGLSGSLELAIRPRGRAIGQYAWVPAAVTPYVGVGGGFVRYSFEQSGDFVDFVDNSIFTATLSSSGWTPEGHVFGGVDFKVAPRILLTTELRYQWANTELQDDFVDFDAIDLAGLRVTGGLQFMF